MKKVN